MVKRINAFDEIYEKCNGEKGEIPVFPRYIDIELTNYCNYRCLMCPTGIGSMTRAQGFMAEGLYRKIIDEVKEYNIGIRFIRWGEPTLHKDFYNFLEIAKDKHIIVHFNTNGLLLEEESMQRMIDLEIESVKFSFQGVDRKSYQEMRNKDAFDDLIAKIKLFHTLRGVNQYPYLHVSTTTTYETDFQIENFKKLVAPYVDLVTVGKTNLAYIQADSSRLSAEERTMLNDLKQKETLVHKHKAICPEVFDKLSVNWDGSVTACCSDYDDFMLVGDLQKSSLKEIWEGKKLEKYRKVIRNKEYDKLHLCKTCFDYIELKR